MYCQKNTTYLIKMVEYDKDCFKSKEKPKYVKKKIVIKEGQRKTVGCRKKNQKIKT